MADYSNEALDLKDENVTSANPPVPVELVSSPANTQIPSSTMKATKEIELVYTVDDVPPWYLCILLGLQHFLTMAAGTIAVPFIVAPRMCVTDHVITAELLATIFFTSGLVTIIQTTVGSRLPIVQGSSFAFFVPVFTILSLPQFKCPDVDSTSANISSNLTADPDLWKSRMLEIQGAMIGASIFEVVIGVCGVVGLLLRFIGPLAIAPTIALVGIALFGPAADLCQGNWYVAIMTIVLITLFSQYLRDVDIPCMRYGEGKCGIARYPIFKLFPVILGILVSWFICYILTITDALPDDPTHWGVAARTDTRSEVITNAKWFRFPYPGQYGMPTFSVAGVFGMLAGIIAGIVESVGDYYACARLAGAPPPPVHAINRGIFIEGLGCILAGLLGTGGSGTTSYSENIGVIGITKVGSRRVILWCGLVMVLAGIISKFGALFVAIPDPIIGGVFMIVFGIITSVGISNLQFVDLNSSRNLFIFGFSLFFGLSLPQWMAVHPHSIRTGSDIVDQLLTVLLSTGMCVGGGLGFLLDNTIPGTDEERGLKEWRQVVGEAGETRQKLQVYNLPFFSDRINSWSWTRYFPLCPAFDPTCGRQRKAQPEADVAVDGNDVSDVVVMDEKK